MNKAYTIDIVKLESIAVKFILNLPDQERNEKTRLAYHYKKAYYFYVDEILKEKNQQAVDQLLFFSRLNSVIKNYMKALNGEKIIEIIAKNKPSSGAIILNERENRVLVIKSRGLFGFPKGGKNERQTSEDCAAREVQEEVGLFIENKIDSSDKVEFDFKGVPVIYYIVRNFDEKEPLKIDENEIDSAFWMDVKEVSKQISRFSKKSKQAWRLFQEMHVIKPKISIQSFLDAYKDINNQPSQVPSVNPLLNFKFDYKRLSTVLDGIK